MSYQQLVEPDLSVVGKSGLCLQYVQTVFNAPERLYNAITAWQATKTKHQVQEPPSDISVPIWFSWQVDGHVAVWNKGTVYSTTDKGVQTFPSIQAMMNYIGGGISYLGWSEDIEGQQVVKEADMPTLLDETDVKAMFESLGGRDHGEYSQAEIDGRVGKDFKAFFYELLASAERSALTNLVITSLFKGSLQRLPTDSELRGWSQHGLKNQASGISDSPEAKQVTQYYEKGKGTK